MQITLDDIRNKMSNFQITCLNHILENYIANGEWIKTKVLHNKLGKSLVVAALNKLGGMVVYESQRNYCLTPLGIFMTQEGIGLEEHLIKFVQYIRDRYIEDAEIESISGADIETYLNIDSSQLSVLKILLFNGGNFIGGGSRGLNNWSVQLPFNVDDLPEKRDLRTYVLEEITKNYDPSCPVYESERFGYSFRSEESNQNNVFDFIDDDLLKDQLNKDWIEAQQVAQHKAWKSCIILCGGILEGLLVNVLSKDLKMANKALKSVYDKREQKTRACSNINRWNLSDLIDVAIETQLISKSTFYVGHALREFRNLVHPGKQVRDNVVVSEEEAEIALNVVKISLKQFTQD